MLLSLATQSLAVTVAPFVFHISTTHRNYEGREARPVGLEQGREVLNLLLCLLCFPFLLVVSGTYQGEPGKAGVVIFKI